MFNSKIINMVEDTYLQGGNIMQFLSSVNQGGENSREAILLSYDYQAGTYVAAYKKNPAPLERYTKQISDEIGKLGEFTNILEAGVGEATTFNRITSNLNIAPKNSYGFDISWSRIKTGNDFLQECSFVDSNLFVADLFDIPLSDNSMDIVYTSHSIEPNGGNEKPILEELYRVTSKYLLLFEPDYEFASDDAKRRMESHGYIKNLYATAKELGYKVIKRELLPFSTNPLNPTSVIIIEKQSISKPKNIFRCPVSKTELINAGEIYFSEESHLMYPVIKNIPCLLKSYAVFGFKYVL